MPAHMVNCPKCGSIQKAGTKCGICGYPIPARTKSDLAAMGYTFTSNRCGGKVRHQMPSYKLHAISRLAGRDIFA